jgi:hypothetical protein
MAGVDLELACLAPRGPSFFSGGLGCAGERALDVDLGHVRNGLVSDMRVHVRFETSLIRLRRLPFRDGGTPSGHWITRQDDSTRCDGENPHHSEPIGDCAGYDCADLPMHHGVWSYMLMVALSYSPPVPANGVNLAPVLRSPASARINPPV